MLGFYWGYVGIMEKKMEATIYSSILGLYMDSMAYHSAERLH